MLHGALIIDQQLLIKGNKEQMLHGTGYTLIVLDNCLIMYMGSHVFSLQIVLSNFEDTLPRSIHFYPFLYSLDY